MTGFPRLERGVLALGLAGWPTAALVLLFEGPWRGALPATLYQYFAVATLLGWVAGNLCVQRRRRLDPGLGRRLGWLYLVCPPALLFVLRGLAASQEYMSAPLVPIYAAGVYTVFFALPITLRRSRT